MRAALNFQMCIYSSWVLPIVVMSIRNISHKGCGYMSKVIQDFFRLPLGTPLDNSTIGGEREKMLLAHWGV